jgi:predicted DNA-binding protein
MLTFEIHPELEARLERLAKRKKQTKDAYARRTVLEYLEDLEDLARKQLAALDFTVRGRILR